jgi:hypothetical protein
MVSVTAPAVRDPTFPQAGFSSASFRIHTLVHSEGDDTRGVVGIHVGGGERNSSHAVISRPVGSYDHEFSRAHRLLIYRQYDRSPAQAGSR